jgi:phage gpG-like protein
MADALTGSGEIATVGGRVRFTMSVPNGESIDLMLSRFGDEVADWRPFFRDVLMPRVAADVQANFEAEGGNVGGWDALSPAYAAWKEKFFPGRKILELTGRLKGSLTWDGGPGPNAVYEDSPTAMAWGTRVPYGRAHQYGVPDRNLPERRFLWLDDPEVYGKLMHEWLVERAGSAGMPVRDVEGVSYGARYL